MTKRSAGTPRVSVKQWSPLGKHGDNSQEVLIDRPSCLDGDDTAYAYYADDSGLRPFIQPGNLIFLTRRRDPRENDMILIWKSEGKPLLRILSEITSNGLSVLASSRAPKAFQTEKISFDGIAEIAVVAMVQKI